MGGAPSRTAFLRAALAGLLAVGGWGQALAAGSGEAASDSFIVAAGDTIWLTAPIIVTGRQVAASVPVTGRSVAVLDADELASLPLRSFQEGLDLLPEVSLQQRQQFGTQGDLSIRGATHAQAQVLLDGLDVTDSQTGHHALDLPLEGPEIARVAVVPGHGALLAAGSSPGGSLNVVAREPADAARGEVRLDGGDVGTWGLRGLVESGLFRLGGRAARGWLSGSWFTSDGDRPGTDVERRHGAARLAVDAAGGTVDLLAGWTRREFGALDFYAPYPSWERTEVLVSRLRYRRSLGGRAVLEQDLLYRRHEDRFVLWRDEPDRYRNDHLTRRGLAVTRLRVDAGHGFSVAAAVDGMTEDLHSTGVRGGSEEPALGTHVRRRLGAAVEVGGRHGPFGWSAAERIDGWQGHPTRWTRSGAVAWTVGPELRLRVSSGTLLRMPSFTELYYRDPVNEGSADLRPERGWSWDAGVELAHGPWRVTWGYFERRERDLIDWTRPAGVDTVPWRARNIATGLVRGWSQALDVGLPRGATLRAAYTHLDIDRDLPAGWEGKYVSLAPRHELTAACRVPVVPWLELSTTARYRVRAGGASDLTVDAALAVYRAPWRAGITVTNIGDADIEQVPGVLLPGRLATCSLSLAF